MLEGRGPTLPSTHFAVRPNPLTKPMAQLKLCLLHCADVRYSLRHSQGDQVKVRGDQWSYYQNYLVCYQDSPPNGFRLGLQS